MHYPLNLGKDPATREAIMSIWRAVNVVVNPAGSVQLNHNSTLNKEGGGGGHYYHLNQQAYTYLAGQDQAVQTTSNVQFNALTIGVSPDQFTVDSSGVVQLSGAAMKQATIPIHNFNNISATSSTYGSMQVPIYQFSDGATNEISAVTFISPPLYTPQLSIVWNTAATSGDCYWRIGIRYGGPDELVDGSAEFTYTIASTASSTSAGLVRAVINITDPPTSTDHLLLLTIARLGGDSNDTLSDTVNLFTVSLHYKTDRL